MCPLGSCLSCSRQKPSLYMMDCTSIFLCVRLLHALLFPAGCCVDPWGFVFTSAISLPCKTQVFLVLLTRGCMLASCWRAIVLLSQIMETFILTDFCSCYVKSTKSRSLSRWQTEGGEGEQMLWSYILM
uniref:Uncharacterized protein n=1 Tax=Triticum urartu TaxID=4572 RepID=A0A8R7V3R8_TRIUA